MPPSQSCRYLGCPQLVADHHSFLPVRLSRRRFMNTDNPHGTARQPAAASLAAAKAWPQQRRVRRRRPLQNHSARRRSRRSPPPFGALSIIGPSMPASFPVPPDHPSRSKTLTAAGTEQFSQSGRGSIGRDASHVGWSSSGDASRSSGMRNRLRRHMSRRLPLSLLRQRRQCPQRRLRPSWCVNATRRHCASDKWPTRRHALA